MYSNISIKLKNEIKFRFGNIYYIHFERLKLIKVTRK